jgi:tellurite resistance protein TehA-like permease
VLKVVLCLHVFVQLLLGVQLARQDFGEKTLSVDTTQSSWALCFPLVDLALCADSCVKIVVPYASRTLILLFNTHCASVL